MEIRAFAYYAAWISTVKENVERRFTEFSQHDDYISIIDVYLPSVFEDYSFVKQDVFFLYYKNNKKFHTTEVFNILNLKIFLINLCI